VEIASSRPNGHHHGNLPEALEAAALELIEAKGVRGFTLADASRKVGVSVAAPFRHYAGREGLLAALATRSYETQATVFSAAMQGQADPIDQLAEFAAAYVRFAVEHRALFEVAYSGIDKTGEPQLENAGMHVLDILLEPCRSLRPSHAEARELLYGIAAMARGYSSFLGEGVFGSPAEGLLHAEHLARTTARQLAHT
jgi:AcrR family transcriptional regulator